MSGHQNLPRTLAELTKLLASLQDAANFTAGALGAQGEESAGAVELLALALDRAAGLCHQAEALACGPTNNVGAL